MPKPKVNFDRIEKADDLRVAWSASTYGFSKELNSELQDTYLAVPQIDLGAFWSVGSIWTRQPWTIWSPFSSSFFHAGMLDDVCDTIGFKDLVPISEDLKDEFVFAATSKDARKSVKITVKSLVKDVVSKDVPFSKNFVLKDTVDLRGSKTLYMITETISGSGPAIEVNVDDKSASNLPAHPKDTLKFPFAFKMVKLKVTSDRVVHVDSMKNYSPNLCEKFVPLDY